MTAILEAPATMTSESPPATGDWRGRWRVAARLASRQVRRTALSSALISTLIMLPIAAMTGYAVITASVVATPSERVTTELGRSEAWMAVAGLPDSGFWQAPTDVRFTGYAHSTSAPPTGAPVEDPASLLPAGTKTIQVVQGTARVRTDDGVTTVQATSGEVWDESLVGRFDLVDGRAPENDNEALVSPATLDRLGIRIGEELILPDDDLGFTVTGTMTSAPLAADMPAIFLPPSAPLRGETGWYVPDLTLDWDAVKDLNAEGIVVLSRVVLLEPPDMSGTDADLVSDRYETSRMSLLIMLGAAAVFSAYVVIMLAGAAFAVAARRQQRSLAVAASVGATGSDLRRAILLQGTVLGIVGGIAGTALGIGAAAAVMASVRDGSATQFPGFHLPWEMLLPILAFAVVVGTASAALPARTVAGSDILTALRGARRPQHPRASRPIWGSLLLLLGIAVTLGSAVAAVTVNDSDLPSESPLRVVGPAGIIIGPIVVQLGVLVSGRWLLWMTSRIVSRLGLTARLASRDASANSSRTVPAFAAIGATVFIGVFALSSVSMQNANNAREWFYQGPVGSLSVAFGSAGTGELPALTEEQRADASDAAVDLVRSAGATTIAIVQAQSDRWEESVAADAISAIAILPDRYLIDPDTTFRSHGQDPSDPLSVISADEIQTALGATLSTDQLQAYRDGAAISTDPRYVTDGSITMAAWSSENRDEMPTNIWPESSGSPWAEPVWERELDAVSLDLPLQPVAIAIAPETAQRLGITVYPHLVIGGFTATVGTEVRDRVGVHADTLSSPDWTLSAAWEDGPRDDALWMIPIIAAVATLVLGASAVALGLARFERRPDDATLSAIGATNGVRRRIGLWQGLIIAGMGTIAGASAGILPSIGIAMQSAGALRTSDIPWSALIALAVALPLGIAFVSWLVPPRHPDLTRRTVIA